MAAKLRPGTASETQCPPDSPIGTTLEVPIGLTHARLASMHRAALAILACEREANERDTNVVAEVLRGSAGFVEYEHYPDGDVFDPGSHAQYFYHAHRGHQFEHGHFHLFVREPGIPKVIAPADTTGLTSVRVRPQETCHLVAISMDRWGVPIRLFTVNRWVTDDTWYASRDVVELLDRFAFEPSLSPGLVNRWVSAMVQLYWPQITVLLAHRDQVIGDWRARHPRRRVLEDRRLEVTSYLDISVETQCASVFQAMAAVRRPIGQDRRRSGIPRANRPRESRTP